MTNRSRRTAANGRSSWHGPCVSRARFPVPRPFPESRSLAAHAPGLRDTCSRLRWRSARSSRPTCGCSRSSSQDKVRIAPPNPFVARIVMLALLAALRDRRRDRRPGRWSSAPTTSTTRSCRPRSALVVLLTLNAFVLHHVTFPRLARGRRVPRWNVIDWIVVAVPVATSNFLWMFIAFLGVARPGTTPCRCATSSRSPPRSTSSSSSACSRSWPWPAGNVQPDHRGWADRLARSLAAVGSLGRTAPHRRRRRSRRRGVAAAARRRPMPRAPAPPRCRRSPAEPASGGDPPGAAPGGRTGSDGARRASLASGLAARRGPPTIVSNR